MRTKKNGVWGSGCFIGRRMLRNALPVVAISGLFLTGSVHAQRTRADATASANDAFGSSVGDESVGLYSSSSVRGFSPVAAGNIRVEGLYVDRIGGFSDRLMERSAIRVGIASQNYLFPAPTGIADYTLRQVSGTMQVSSRLGYGPYGGLGIEFDAGIPISGTDLGIAFGAGAYADESANGSDSRTVSYAVIPRWRPTGNLEIVPLFSAVITDGKKPSPVYMSTGGYVPSAVRRRHYIGPQWADGTTTNTHLGVMANLELSSGWKVSSGLFRSSMGSEDSVSYRLSGMGEDRMADRIISADPLQETVSNSGEVLVGRHWFAGGDVRHELNLSLRGKERSNLRGGGQSVYIGRMDVEAKDVSQAPAFSFSERSRESVSQLGAGVSYAAQVNGLGSLNAGVQKVAYEKRIHGAGPDSEDDPMLYSLAASWTPTDGFAIYASRTRGLEEAGSAPDYAANRAQLMPAIRTVQSDAGILRRTRKGLRLVAGYFNVQKPYFDLDSSGVYGVTGDVTHEGLEISLSGQAGENTSLLLGAVLMDPVVTGMQGTNDEDMRPVGQSRNNITFSSTHSPVRIPGLSLNTSINYYGSKPADKHNTMRVGGYTQIDLGARYRFRLGRSNAMLRFQMTNLTNEFSWRVLGSDIYDFNSPRSYSLSLIIDS